jgi:hypothetical protein
MLLFIRRLTYIGSLKTRSYYILYSSLTDLYGSASKFVLFFVRTFEKVPARVLAGLPDSRILCFVTVFTQR